MRAYRLAAGSVIAATLWAGATAAQPAAAPAAWHKMGVHAYEQPRPAPAFALPALDSRTVRIEDQKGKALLLFFWATW